MFTITTITLKGIGNGLVIILVHDRNGRPVNHEKLTDHVDRLIKRTCSKWLPIYGRRIKDGDNTIGDLMSIHVKESEIVTISHTDIDSGMTLAETCISLNSPDVCECVTSDVNGWYKGD